MQIISSDVHTFEYFQDLSIQRLRHIQKMIEKYRRRRIQKSDKKIKLFDVIAMME